MLFLFKYDGRLERRMRETKCLILRKKKKKGNPLPYFPSIKAGRVYQGRGLATNLTRLAFGITRLEGADGCSREILDAP